MRDKDEVMEKFEEVRAAKLRERKQAFLGRIPLNCSGNLRMRVKGKGQVGFCQNPSVLARFRRGLFVCNDEETSRGCGEFLCRNTEESVEKDFDDIMRSPARCGRDYPKLAMLIWFLQEFEVHGRWSKLRVLCGRAASALWGVVSLRWW